MMRWSVVVTMLLVFCGFFLIFISLLAENVPSWLILVGGILAVAGSFMGGVIDPIVEKKTLLRKMKERAEELLRWQRLQEENKARFLEVVSGFGFNDPVRQVLEASKRTQIKWEVVKSEASGLGETHIYKATLFDGIEVIAGMDSTPHASELSYWLYFKDRKERFDVIVYYCDESCNCNGFPEYNPAVKEYLDWLIERFPAKERPSNEK